MSMIGSDIVMLSTADWDNPFWTNKQHVACELAARGCRVLYVDSLGLRRPSASTQDLKRIARRLCKVAAAPRLARENLWVWSPVALPFQRYAAVRASNRIALSATLAAHRRRLGMRAETLWTYNPMTTRLLDVRGFARLVYHCVDDIGAQPGMPAAALAAVERELVERADIVFATSPKLAETRAAWNPATHYMPNVADYDHFVSALDPTTEVAADLAALPRPRVGFIGAISGYKLDFALIRHIAESRPAWSVVLIGKVGEGDPWTDARELDGLPNLHLLGPRSYETLPSYLKGFDAAMLPSARNEYTDSMFPMKFFEYLAAGRPVVSVELPALAEFASAARLCGSPAAFVDALAAAIDGRGPTVETGLALARRHTYGARTNRMLDLINGAAAADTVQVGMATAERRSA